MKTALWWIRRDLRLTDNQALQAALTKAEQVLPVFVIDPKLAGAPSTGEKRLAFLYDGLSALDNDLKQRGSCLVIRRGEPLPVLAGLLHEVNGEAIFAEADYTPYARRRDQGVKKELPTHFTPGLTVQTPGDVVKDDGSPYTIFTPYSKAWLKRRSSDELLQAPDNIPSPAGVRSEVVPLHPRQTKNTLFTAGENAALRRLDGFTESAISSYEHDRNRMDLEGTSGLSPYLHFGMISARQAVTAARLAEAKAADGASRRGAETWLNELIWREFYSSILYHFPFVLQSAFRPAYRNIPWRNDPQDFAAWTEGRTGYPVVDAAMRQLVQTGWMHNRARMIAASFLTKDLLVDWRWGERFSMQHLIDADLAANNGGWQWSAGTGTDAAPYFRIFNPVSQSIKFDPDGVYIRKFVPELVNVPREFLHQPWNMPTDLQIQVGCVIGSDYPAPVVDHRLARERVLKAYKAQQPVIK